MKAYVQWFIMGLIGLVAIVANLRIPNDLSGDIQLVYQDMLHGDSLLVVRQDSLVLAVSRADSALRADVQAELMNQAKTLADSSRVFRNSMAQIRKSMVSADALGKLESSISVVAQKSDFTESELQLLREAFDDHKSTKAKDVHGDKKIASTSRKSSWFWR